MGHTHSILGGHYQIAGGPLKRLGREALIKMADQENTQRVRAYQELVKSRRPSKPILKNVIYAFFVGGAICEVGQWIQWGFMQNGMTAKEATSPTTVVLIGLGALLTGLGWYDKVVKHGGMGGTLPITGFSNAMVAPAMEFRSEGLVLGVGAKLFTVAGPVLVYGLSAAFVVGLCRYLLTGVA